ncbi:hypothetical protein DM860_006031 [Cuscuta australis]|uniref:Replication factor A C-terminal domain-containing protein n=1 Tax=Cuscuta australis TaxID=267555 RepID=A0A328DJS1_9ASTE|nr:hypothetical protein DM860_006031 [Cuscuta australis]
MHAMWGQRSKKYKEFRLLAEINDDRGDVQLTLFTNELQKILKTLEWNMSLETINCGNLNKALQSLTVIVVIKPTSRTYQTQTTKMYSLLSLYNLSQKLTSTPTLK